MMLMAASNRIFFPYFFQGNIEDVGCGFICSVLTVPVWILCQWDGIVIFGELGAMYIPSNHTCTRFTHGLYSILVF